MVPSAPPKSRTPDRCGRVLSANSAGRRLLFAAAAAGLVHAGFSLYWAFGGRRLLGTVGQWLVDLARARPVAAGAVLVS